MNVGVRVGALSAALAAIVGCASGPRITHVRPALPPSSEVEKVPVRLGLHYDPAFSRKAHARPSSHVVPIGQDSVAMFDEIAPRLVSHVEHVPAPAVLAAGAPPVDFVLEPSLEHFDFKLWNEKVSEVHAVVYRMSVFEPSGALVSSWTVEGRVPIEKPPPRTDGLPNEQRYDPAEGYAHASQNLADAARKLVAGFRKDSRIEEYVARRRSGQSVALEAVEVHAAIEDVPIQLPGVAPSAYAFGLVPVKVRITNRGEVPLDLSVVARLALADGRMLHAPAPSMIVRQLETAGAVANLRNLRYGNIIGGAMATAQGFRLQSQLPAARAAIQDRALRLGALAKGESAEGHLFFLPTYGDLPSGTATLSLWLGDRELRSVRVAQTLALPERPKAAPPASGPAGDRT